MSKQRNIIEFAVIWKKIHGMIIAEAEDRLLQKWKEEDSRHLKFYEQAKRFHAEGSQFRADQELNKAWKNVRQRTNHKMTIIRLAGLAAAVAAGILIAVVSFHHLPDKMSDTRQSAANDTIKPGSDKAILILSDGSQHSLASKQSEVFYEGEIMLHSTGGKLEYPRTEGRRRDLGRNYNMNTLLIPRGGKFFLCLADGTKVWLNSESSLRYPVQFSEKERTVELIGEGYFEVAKNEHSPFFVLSGEQLVKVLGTQFNISSYNESKFIFTTLVEGVVEVFEKGHLHNKCVLVPGRQSVFSKKDLLVSTRKVEPRAFISWKEGRFVFDDESLLSIMHTLSRWYDVEILFANDARKSIRFTGNLPRSAAIHDILAKIEMTNEIKFKINNNIIIIE